MMKKFLALTLVLLLCLMLFPVPGYCGYNPWHGYDRTKLLQRELPYDLIYRGANRGGVSTIVSQVSKLTSTNLAFSILKLSGADKTFTMDAGEVGQEITLVKSEYDARTLMLSFNIQAVDTAHTGFTSVTWPTAAGSYVSLTWLDATIGWIITGSHGVTITY